TASLRARNPVLILREPLLERLKRRVQRSRQVHIPRARKLPVEIVVELKHVADIVGSGKSEASKHRRRYAVVRHRLTKGLTERPRHFLAAQEFAGDTNRLTDVL